jgi:hypothetical protein
VETKKKTGFVEDLRSNGWRYAVPVLGLSLFYGMRAIGIGYWIAVSLPLMAIFLIGVFVSRR